jgi:hypothetical protein
MPFIRPSLGVLHIRDAMEALLEQAQFQEHMLVERSCGFAETPARRLPPDGDA